MKRNWLIISSILIAGCCFGQSPDSVPRIRIVNLLPIGSEKVDLYNGSNPLLKGLKPGFLRGYDVGNSSDMFEIRRGNAVLSKARSDSTQESKFSTLLIFQGSGGTPELKLIDDSLPPDVDENGNPVPPLRLRIYCGNYGFPIQVSTGDSTKWIANKEMLSVDVPVKGVAPESVTVTFFDRFDEQIDLHFPTDFKTNRAYSVFVTHRGTKRPRVAAYPDAVLPMDDPLAPIDQISATPTDASNAGDNLAAPQ